MILCIANNVEISITTTFLWLFFCLNKESINCHFDNISSDFFSFLKYKTEKSDVFLYFGTFFKKKC